MRRTRIVSLLSGSCISLAVFAWVSWHVGSGGTLSGRSLANDSVPVVSLNTQVVETSATATGTAVSATDNAITRTTNIINVEAIPVYPGAVRQDQDFYCSDKTLYNCRYGAIAPASIQEVTAFYKRVFAQEGWTLFEESSIVPVATYLDFVWTNPGQGAPARRFVRLKIGLPAYGESGTYIDAIFQLWPDPNKVPLYPGAAMVQTRWEQMPAYAPERIITYQTNVAPQLVQDFYKQVLWQHGWTENMVDEGDKIHFRVGYHRGLPDDGNWTGSSVDVIISQPDVGGKVRVELRISGTEVDP